MDVPAVAGCAAVTFSARAGHTVDAFEIPWEADVAYLSDEPNALKKLWRGALVALYWTNSSIWLAAFEAPSLIWGLVAGYFAILIWLLVLGDQLFADAAALIQAQNIKASVVIWPGFISRIAIAILWTVATVNLAFSTFQRTFHEWLTPLGYHIAIAVFAALSLWNAAGVNISDFVKRYLTREVDEHGHILPMFLCRHASTAIQTILAAKPYAQVTILGHSAGAAIAVELLASGELKNIPNIRLITLGGSLYVLSLRSAAFQDVVDECARKAEILTWSDFYASKDWLAAKTRFSTDPGAKVEQVEIMKELSWIDAFALSTHQRYFWEARVTELLLN